VILTDGRRGSGGSALAQYKRLGELARSWSSDSAPDERAGLFAIAALNAPFRQKPGDHTGCWAAQSSTVRRCPLYAFVFAPRAGATRLLAALREMPSEVYIAPTFTDTSITVVEDRTASARRGALLTYSASATEPLRLIYHAQHPDGIDSTTVAINVDASASSARFSIDDSLRVLLFAAPLTTGGALWTPIQNSSGAWVKPLLITRERQTLNVHVGLGLRARAQLQPTVYRVELVSTGRPSWLEQFDASEPSDGSRTYGLSSLFEYLQQHPTRLVGFYVSVY
jgi:hypothetical protein